MRTSWVNDASMRLILAAMMPANRLAVEVSEATGLRIDDVLSLKTDTITRTPRPYVVDSKTGKRHRVYLPAQLRSRMLRQAGVVWVWPGRLEPKAKHRSRQAVYKDMVQAAAVFARSGQVPRDATISPHTARKRAAVRAYHAGGLDDAARLLNHSPGDAAVTMLYALSDAGYKPPRKRKAPQAKGAHKVGR